MTDQDAREQFRRVFIAFPGYREWLESTDAPDATLRAWCGMLIKCEVDDVRSVVDAIVTGEAEIRGKYETKDALPLVIRGRAIRMKEKRDEANRIASKTREKQTTKRRRYKLSAGATMPLFAENHKRLRLGEITKEEHAAIVQEITAEAMTEIR